MSVLSNYINSVPATSFNDQFFDPLRQALEQSSHRRKCKEIPDEQYCELGVRRVLENEKSGRAYLEHLADHGRQIIKKSAYFNSLASQRRLDMVVSANQLLRRQISDSTEDDPFDGTTYATGNFFGLNLRTHALFHLIGADRSGSRKKEHDMRALKRLSLETLRQGTKVGRKVIWAWDKASIDTEFWHTCKTQKGIYFISMAKDNMHLQRDTDVEWDAHDPHNTGVTDCARVFAGKRKLTCVWYTCPLNKKSYIFLSTLTQIEPGVIAAIYKARWDIEKTFDETKKKLHEDKSWSTSPVGKSMHAQLCCLTHNLLLICERQSKRDHNIVDVTEESRRTKRLKKSLTDGQENQPARACSPIVKKLFMRASQRSVKFIRIVRNHLRLNRFLNEVVEAMRQRIGYTLT